MCQARGRRSERRNHRVRHVRSGSTNYRGSDQERHHEGQTRSRFPGYRKARISFKDDSILECAELTVSAIPSQKTNEARKSCAFNR